MGAAIALSPFAASAATISNPLFSNGDTTISGQGGASVSGTFTLTVGQNEVVEFLRTQSDPSQPFVDTSVGGQLGYQEGVYTNVPFTVKLPPNTANSFPNVQGAGIFGGIRSINGGDNVVVGPVPLGTVRVTATGSTSTTPPDVGGATTDDAWWAKLATLIAGIFKASQPTVDPLCAQIPSDTSALQQFLMDNGQGAKFAAVGVYEPTGFYGSVTVKALSSFKVAHKCS